MALKMCFGVAFGLAATCVWADQATVPSSANGVELVSTQEGALGANASRRLQVVMDPQALSGIPIGSRLTAIRFRLSNGATTSWPASDVNFAQWTLSIFAAATTSTTMSTTYASNSTGSGHVTVSGLSVEAGAYTASATGTTPESFGPAITFSAPFTYTGGGLCLNFVQSGTGVGANAFMDATSDPANDHARSLYATSTSATTGSLTSAPVIRFEYTPPPNAIAPASAATFDSSAGNEGPLGGTTARRFQYNIEEAAMSVPYGSIITGMMFRLDSVPSIAWPEANLTISDYEVRLSAGVGVDSLSTVYANNITSPQVLVRDGPLVLNKGIFSAEQISPSAEQFGIYIPFSTPYPYFGGTLSVDINYPGTGLGANASVDSQTTSQYTTTRMRGLYGFGSRTAANGVYSGAPVTRFLISSGPAPILNAGATKVYISDTFASEEGEAFLTTPFRTLPRSLMSVASESQLNTIGNNAHFVGHSLRLVGGSGAWPAAPVTFSSYSINLSRSVNPPGALSPTFASNIGADNTLVRSGSLTVPAGGYRGLPSNSPFGWSIPYQTPYVYRGGPLNIFVRHEGNPTSEANFSAVALSNPDNDTKVQTLLANDAISTTGNPFQTPVTRFDVDAGLNVPNIMITPQPIVSNGILSDEEVTHQAILSADELRDIPIGSVLTSLSLRSGHFNSVLPVNDASTEDFELTISTAAVRPENISEAFALNEGDDKVRVYDGFLAIRAGTFFGGGTPQRFSKVVDFQRAFVYRGGDLCITIRHKPFSARCAAAVAPSAGSAGRAVEAGDFDAATGFPFDLGEAKYIVAMRFGFIPSTCTPFHLGTNRGGVGRPELASTSTFQVVIPASELRSIDVGSAISGLSLRNYAFGSTPTFPGTPTTFTRYDITVAPATVGPLAMSNTFSSNYFALQGTLVRYGPLTVPANAFPASPDTSTQSEFAWVIPFDRAAIYRGGDLCITFRIEGSMPGAVFDGDGFAPSFDGASRIAVGNANATTATSSQSAPAIRLLFTSRAFCPADLDRNGQVDDADFVLFVSAYNILDCNDPLMPVACMSDLTRDRVVDDFDFVAFLGAYNELVCPD